MTTTLRGLKKDLSLRIAMITIGIWAISLWNCAQIQVDTLNPISAIALVAWQTWLYTGLFITAHDAMHGSIHPSVKLNHAIGQICLWLYAGFNYHQLKLKHQIHHQYPASEQDPDFHGGVEDVWAWYGHFVREHISWRQVINLAVLCGIYVGICRFSMINLLLFWICPSLLSSFQLFYFGTFLPHREPSGGYVQPHRAYTIERSRWWSLLTCYHFGYHQEHHESPQIPWWQLYRT